MELQELYHLFLEADQERNERVTHYTHYGQQIPTTSMSQSLPFRQMSFLFCKFNVVAYTQLYKLVG